MSKPTENKIWAEIDKAIAYGNPYPGMTYAQGVEAALRWALDDSQPAPLDEEG